MQTDDIRGAAAARSGRLVYAKPQDLPSFPSVGLKPNGSAASAAASLGWANQRSPEYPRPNMSSSSASAAAMIAKDHKSAPQWTPSPSAHGAQAALLAHKSAKPSEGWQPSATEHGQSAATQAFKVNGSAPQKSNVNALDRQKSLMAARGAMTTRPRAQSSPVVPKEAYPDEANAAANALHAAASVHKSSRTTVSKDAGATPYVHMNPRMFTSNPPVKPEVDAKNREDQLHASAVAMAKKIYGQQQRVIEQTKKSQGSDPSAPRSHRRMSDDSDDDEVAPMQFDSLQSMAYKLAQERLAKMHEENLKNRDYHEYYGQSKVSRKFSIRPSFRRRASSDGDVEDQRRSQQIRDEMSIFSTKLTQVDQQKRQHDRDAVMAAAQRNVQARLKGMDEKITAQTGMVPPTRLSEWEVKAHALAQSRSDQRMTHHGKVNLGAGKYMTSEDIDAIAAQRVQPVLDEINEKAEQERARQTELRLEAEARQKEKDLEKAREKDLHDAQKKVKEQEKQELKEKKAEEKKESQAKKVEEKHKKDQEKSAKAELKRAAKEQRRKSAPPDPLPQADRGEAAEATEDAAEPESTVAMNDVGQPVRVPATSEQAAVEEEENPHAPEADATEAKTKSSPSSPTGKVKTWFRSRFSRESKSDVDTSKSKKGGQGFIGGVALTGTEGANESTTSVDNRSASMRAIAMAGRQTSGISVPSPTVRSPDAEAVSPMNSSSDDEYFRDEAPDAGLSPPQPLKSLVERKSASPVRDSKFHEII